jgi:hypothetical protein
MLTREQHPKINPPETISQDDHRLGMTITRDRSRGFGENLLLNERGRGFEGFSQKLKTGELVEAWVTDKEAGVCFDNLISAVYDRGSGALMSASFSLTRAVLDAKGRRLSINKMVRRKVKELRRDAIDVVVVVNFDEDGEIKISSVMTESGKATRRIAAAGVEDMEHDYSFPEDGQVVDFLDDEEKELVGELILAWRHICRVTGIDFGVGVRTQVLDFVMINSRKLAGFPYHVAELLDLSVFDGRSLDARLSLRLVSEAFPEVDLMQGG